MQRRAAVFVDGSNLYKNLRNVGIKKGKLDYGSLSRKLVQTRTWVGTYFYGAPVRPEDEPEMARQQQRFFSYLEKTKNVILKLGVLEPRYEPCKICKKTIHFMVEKGVDVLISVDMISKALANEYDDAYLVSADADFVPLVEFLRYVCKKKVYCVSPKGSKYGKLAKVCDTAIPIDQDFIDACQAF